MRVRNNFQRTLQISDASLEGVNCNSSELPVSLKPGEIVTIDCEVNNSQATADVPSMNFLWCDTLLGQSFDVEYGEADPNYDYNGSCGSSSSAGVSPFVCNQSSAGGFFYNGTGTVNDPYGVCNCTMLQDINQSPTVSFQLLDNIECKDTVNWNGGQGWSPIGLNTQTRWSGTFDGRGYEIRNLYINRQLGVGFDPGAVGLFGTGDGGGVIENVGVRNSTILVNQNDGHLDTRTGLILGHGSAGNTIVNNTWARGTITGNPNAHIVGGLVGSGLVDVYNSYAVVNITTNSADRVGRVLGEGNVDIFSTYYDSDNTTCNACSNSDGALVWSSLIDASFLKAQGWNFTDIWSNATNNTDYPLLQQP